MQKVSTILQYTIKSIHFCNILYHCKVKDESSNVSLHMYFCRFLLLITHTTNYNRHYYNT